MFIEKHIVGDFYYVNHFVNNVITDGFTKEKRTPKTIYRHYSVSNSISEFDKSLTENTFIIPSVIASGISYSFFQTL
jgi:hypothetical protein